MYMYELIWYNIKTFTFILQIENTHSVLGKFPGHLLKLEINCNKDLGIYEWHYVLLKIAGSPRATVSIYMLFKLTNNS